MLSRQQFKTWNIFDCGLEKSSTGYNYWETRALADELVQQGETVRIFCHRVAPSAELFPGAEVIPTFAVSLYALVSTHPASSMMDNFVVHNRRFCSDLARLGPTLFRNSLALFPIVTERQLLGLFRWFGALPSEMRPKVALSLFEPRGEWTEANLSARAYKTLWRECPPELKKEIAIFSRTPQAAAKFTTELGIPAAVYPFVLPECHFPSNEDAARAAQGSMIVSFVGGLRRERGSALIADVVKQCSGLGVQFLIQVRSGLDSKVDDRELIALSALDHVRVKQGALERDDYYRVIKDSVVLLAYEPSAYRWRDSGVYHEAKLLGAPVLVTAGTWMADEVRSLGNGLVIEAFSVPSIVASIAQAQRELPALREAAARAGKYEREKNGVARCIAAVADAFASSVTS